ncbi:MAG: DUF2244 domain-containing protein [Gammaproteobacteria bacterium]|nr:DUF2244 domain-containing protein [Gammaproteobacteria bacterium]
MITLDPVHTRIEKGAQRIDQRWEFQTPWIQILEESYVVHNSRRMLTIRMNGEFVEVGSFLANSEMGELVFQLKDCIIHI